MTDPESPPPWWNLIVGCALVFAAVLWLPAIVKFDGDAKGTIDHVFEWLQADLHRRHVVDETAGEPPPPSPPATVTSPPTTLPRREPPPSEARIVFGLVQSGLANVDEALTVNRRFEREVKPLLASDEGRLIATYPSLTAEFAAAFRRHRPTEMELQALREDLQIHVGLSEQVLLERRGIVERLHDEAARERSSVVSAFEAISAIRRRAAGGGLLACLPLGQVLDDPWLVRRVCGPLPLSGGCCPGPFRFSSPPS